MLNSYLELNFDVLRAGTNNRYADNIVIRLVNLGPISLFSKYKLTTSSGIHLEKVEHGLVACLMYELLTTARRCDDLSIGFHRDCDLGQRELTNNKKLKGKYHVRIYLKGYNWICKTPIERDIRLGIYINTNQKN